MSSEADGVVGTDEELHSAPAFASGSSHRPAFQEAQAKAQAVAIQSGAFDAAGQSLPTNPIILRDVSSRADAPPTQALLNRLHRALTQRDLVLLQSLYDYRYLNTLQVKELFFPSLRAGQMRLETLKDLGLVYSWKVIETPGVRRRHSLHLLSTLGARVLADRNRAEPRSFAERARSARDHCWHAIHDLEANQFFISLIIQSQGRSEEGLLAWYGEDNLRAHYRLKAREYKWPAPAPDGGGVYLASSGEIQFDVEWDRATESTARLRQKIAAHVGYWEHFRNASHQHVLIVVPTDEREDRLQHAIWQERPHFSSDDCCSFWTTTAHRLRQWGPLGAIWLGVNLRADKAPRAADARLRLRTPLTRLAPIRRSDGPVADLIGEPNWWLRRPGGGQVT